MLKKGHRLKKKKDFERVSMQGGVERSGFLVLRFVRNNEDKTRVGFVCSKKISKKAVVRNKIRRRMKQAVRKQHVFLKKGYDIVFFARPAITNKDFWDIEKDIGQILKDAKLLS